MYPNLIRKVESLSIYLQFSGLLHGKFVHQFDTKSGNTVHTFTIFWLVSGKFLPQFDMKSVNTVHTFTIRILVCYVVSLYPNLIRKMLTLSIHLQYSGLLRGTNLYPNFMRKMETLSTHLQYSCLLRGKFVININYLCVSFCFFKFWGKTFTDRGCLIIG